MARRLGATDAMLDAIANAQYDVLEEPWRSAMRYADELTPTAGTASTARYADLASYWNPAQIVELTSVVCLFAFFNRFARALDIPVTR